MMTSPTTSLYRPLINQYLLMVLVIFITALVLSITYYTTYHTLHTKLEQDATYHLAHLKSKLDALLKRYSYLPEVLAQNPKIIEYLSTTDRSITQQQTMNEYLELLNQQAVTQDIYLKDTTGLTLTASNWHSTNTFIGQNYHFRPYFQQAMQGKLGRYYALGTASKERGYYFSYAVRNAAQVILGVITVKVNITHFEQDWAQDQSPAEFMITDEFGVIFMTSQSAWSLRSLVPLTAEAQRLLNQTRRYNGQIIQALLKADQTPLNLNDSKWHWSNVTYTHIAQVLPQEGWTAHILINQARTQRQLLLTMLVASLVMSMIWLVLYFAWRMSTERRRYEQQVLESLEIKVEERTQALKQAQHELIQAAKMAALGQLAASINHELNNPLSAIRIYADNAQQFMSLGHYDFVMQNLTEITQLTERMSAITQQLKMFSRKSQGNLQACSIEGAIQAALLIMHPPMLKQGVELQTQYAPSTPLVWADPLWLEQIIVNLISNAIDATTNNSGKRIIHLSTEYTHQQVFLLIHDNGTGIQEMDLPHIFEAFFTTKSAGQGLGLGLSISYRLAKDMQGDLTVTNHSEGGALFTLSLPIATTLNYDTNITD